MPARILVVDDASFIRDMVKKHLRTLLPGVSLFEAVDGQRAQALLKKQPVDIILSDWEMPGLSGQELLAWVRAQESLVKTPFVMVTSRGDREFVVKAVQAGVSDYLVKPFSAEELMTKVTKQLKRLGINPKKAQASGARGVAFGSVEALTGGAATKPKPAQPTARTPAKPANKKVKKGMAQLRTANWSGECLIREMSLQALNGVISRSASLPGLFDAAVLDISDAEGKPVARVNAYVSSLQAAEPHVDTRLIKITLRFVDDDPAKFEQLSKYIARL